MTRRSRAVAVAAAAAAVAGCTNPQPSTQSLAAEPVLAPLLPHEVELGTVTMQPRQSRIGVPSRDGVVERVVAVDLLPAATADLIQQRHDSRYGFRRVDLGVGTPATVELRGESPTGAEVIVKATSGRPVPLYGSPNDVRTPPADRSTTVVISVISRQ